MRDFGSRFFLAGVGGGRAPCLFLFSALVGLVRMLRGFGRGCYYLHEFLYFRGFLACSVFSSCGR